MAATIEIVDGRVPVRSLSNAASGSMTEGILGAASIVVCVVGLSGGARIAMASAAAILLGCAFLIQGGALSGLTRFFTFDAELEAKVGGVTGAEFFGGWMGLLCGIIAAIGVSPLVLLPMAAVSFGGSLMMGSAVFTPIDRLPVTLRDDERGAAAKRGNIAAASGAEVLGGICSLLLGLFGLVRWANADPLTLTLSALIVCSVAVLLGGSTAGRRIRLGYRA